MCFTLSLSGFVQPFESEIQAIFNGFLVLYTFSNNQNNLFIYFFVKLKV